MYSKEELKKLEKEYKHYTDINSKAKVIIDILGDLGVTKVKRYDKPEPWTKIKDYFNIVDAWVLAFKFENFNKKNLFIKYILFQDNTGESLNGGKDKQVIEDRNKVLSNLVLFLNLYNAYADGAKDLDKLDIDEEEIDEVEEFMKFKSKKTSPEELKSLQDSIRIMITGEYRAKLNDYIKDKKYNKYQVRDIFTKIQEEDFLERVDDTTYQVKSSYPEIDKLLRHLTYDLKDTTLQRLAEGYYGN